jgi:MFS family permease
MTLTEFNWVIPISWVGVYSTLYMKALGLSAIEIGMVIGIGIGVQAAGAAIGGVLADRWGHKRTLIAFDLLGWPVAMTVFAFAQDIRWIVLGTVLNNLCFVVAPAWQCMFVEHAPKTSRAKVYAVFQIVINLSNLAVPVAGLIIDGMGLVSGSRFIYGFTAVSTGLGVLIRALNLKDTKVSVRHLKVKTHRQPLSRETAEFGKAFLFLKKNPTYLWFLIGQTAVAFAFVMWGTYSSIYLTDRYGLDLSETAIPVFQFVVSLVMMAVLLLVIPNVGPARFRRFIIGGLFLILLASLLYAVSPAQKMSFILVASILSGAGTAFFRPLTDTYNINSLPDAMRARGLSVLNTVIILATIPAGPLAGRLYEYEPRLAFLGVSFFLMAGLAIVILKFRYKNR